MKKLSNRYLRHVLAALLVLVFVGCGTSDGGAAGGGTVDQITPTGRLFSIEDFETVGFKIAREYDVEGLTGAASAWFGFWRPAGSDSKEFEIRFYPSHEDAVLHGPFFADEATGEAAILDEDEASWSEGIKDRRYFFAGQIGTHGSGSVQAKYGGYIIYGNMVLMCEGANPEHSLDRCSALVDAIISGSAQ